MSEDCLTLNVWTPRSGPERRPVMVFIHGGGFVEGSAANSWYDGAALSMSGDVVVVTLQYRLGALGFLDLSGQPGGASYVGSGNLGLTDQIEALRWVQRNISALGGDPSNVTLFGESAGGTSIRALQSIPDASRLFHKIIIQSGPALWITKSRATEAASVFMREAGARSVQQLTRLSAEKLMEAQSRFFESEFGDEPFGFVSDAPPFNRPPTTAVVQDPSLSKPMLIGTNAEELRYWIALVGNGIESTPAEVMLKRLTSLFGTEAGPILRTYRDHSENYEAALTELIGDAKYRISSIRLAEINSARQPTFMYRFSYRSPTRGPTGLEYGAMHGLDVAFVFEVDSPQGYSYVGPKGTWTHLSTQMAESWSRFARYGDPNGDFSPHWPAYNVDTRATMNFDRHSDVVIDPNAAGRRAWERVPSAQLEGLGVMLLAEGRSANER